MIAVRVLELCFFLKGANHGYPLSFIPVPKRPSAAALPIPICCGWRRPAEKPPKHITRYFPAWS